MYLIWTTTENRADAERIAADVVARQLAACVQIEGPIISHYRWQGQAERAEEYRMCFKCLPESLPALEKHILAVHPYDTPEWLAVAADRVGEKYLSWARANSTTPPL
jgi:periplasmic divalent cation tolerance protein